MDIYDRLAPTAEVKIGDYLKIEMEGSPGLNVAETLFVADA